MKIAFRTDASLQIGTGHVMRCLTLADALRERGAHTTFICRPQAGDMLEWIRQRGHAVKALFPAENNFNAPVEPIHANWLGTDWVSDAAQTQAALNEQSVDWLVVDHYALDERWERALKVNYQRLLVLDDLADRRHACDLLLDQTFGRAVGDYSVLVPNGCKVMCGAEYALLRPEFAALRAYSLERRLQSSWRELLITMGGIDKDNATGRVLKALRACHLPADCRISVVMGESAPWLKDVCKQALVMPRPTRVFVGVTDMAKLMADCDLAIGAAGATSWERCCLGLPSVMLVLAENQLKVASGLKEVGAAALIATHSPLESQFQALLSHLLADEKMLSTMSVASAGIVDGMGVHLVISQMMN